MKTTLFSALCLGILALLPGPRADARIDVDFRLELGWRADYDHEFESAVILYEYSGYRGRRLVLYPGEQLDDFYDYEWGFRVRSVEVIGPVHVVLFDESGLWGHQLTLYSSADDLGDYRMRLNDYSTFRWHRRARSAYVSFNESNYSVSIEIGPHLYPRLYCARPIIPIYYDPWPAYRWHCPRPTWDYDRWRHRAPVPPPNARPYRPGQRPPVGRPPHTLPPGVSTPPPVAVPPSTRPPGVPPPTGRPGATPGQPPQRPNAQPGGTTPPSAPPSMDHRPRQNPGQTPSAPPSGRDYGRQTPPSAPPANRPNQGAPSNTPSHGQPPTTAPAPSASPPPAAPSQPRPSIPPSAPSYTPPSQPRPSTPPPAPTYTPPSSSRSSAPAPSRSSASPPSRPSSPPPSRSSSPSRSNPPPRPH